MNYSGFKKVHDDNEKVIFKHKNGAELKVAKKGLSAKHLQDIGKLPLYAADGPDTSQAGADNSDDSAALSPTLPSHDHRTIININTPPQQNQSLAGPNATTMGDIWNRAKSALTSNWGSGPSAEDIRKSGSVDQATLANRNKLAQDTVAPNTPQANLLNALRGKAGVPAQAEVPEAMPQAMTEPQAGESNPGDIPVGGADAGSMAGTPIPPPPSPGPTGEEGMPATPATPQIQTSPGDQFVDQMRRWSQDLAIHPQTYRQLLWYQSNPDGSPVLDKNGQPVEKGFFGKLATGFGLLMSAAGSGLAHQPNAIMAMMDNQIKNDLMAQEKTKQNQLSFGDLLDKHLMNQANMVRGQANINHLALQDQVVRQQYKLSAARRYYMQRLYNDVVQKYPEGTPDRMRAEQAYAQMSQGIDANDQAAAPMINSRFQLYNNLLNGTQNGQPSPEADQTGIDNNRFNNLEIQSQQKLLGAPSATDLENMTKEATAVKEARSIRQTYIDSFRKLNQMALAGGNSHIYTQRRAAYVNALAAKMATLTSHRYNAGEAAAQAEGMFPSWNDLGGSQGKTRDIKFQKGLESIAQLEAGTPTLDRFHAKIPLQPETLHSEEIRYDKKGVAWKRGPNGTPVRAQR